MHYFFLLICLVLPPSYVPLVVNKPFPHKEMRDSTKNYIVIHYDDGIDPKTTLRWLHRRHTSYHYFILRDGTIYKLIDPKYQASHAGRSWWDDLMGMNKYSIGICLQNDGTQPYTDIQYRSLAWLINIQRKRYPDITNDRIVGHGDIAFPRGRKHDPGTQFDWSRIKPQRSDTTILIGGNAADPISFIFPIYFMGNLPAVLEATIY